MKNVVVFSDRDGTINLDENYFLGTNPDWKSQVKFLEGVIDGIRLINSIPKAYFFILTNQSGVALKGGHFDNLSEHRMHEVNAYITSLLKAEGLRIDGCFACPFVDQKYADGAAAKGRVVHKEYIVNEHPDMKPNSGMIKKALASVKLNQEDCEIFVIGDRFSDVEMALNVDGTGILVTSYKTKELGDVEKVQKMSGAVHVVSNFLEACRIVLNKFQ